MENDLGECVCGEWHRIVHVMAGMPVIKCPSAPDGGVFIVNPNFVYFAPVGPSSS